MHFVCWKCDPQFPIASTFSTILTWVAQIVLSIPWVADSAREDLDVAGESMKPGPLLRRSLQAESTGGNEVETSVQLGVLLCVGSLGGAGGGPVGVVV